VALTIAARDHVVSQPDQTIDELTPHPIELKPSIFHPPPA
jgi:hypothetical protein